MRYKIIIVVRATIGPQAVNCVARVRVDLCECSCGEQASTCVAQLQNHALRVQCAARYCALVSHVRQSWGHQLW